MDYTYLITLIYGIILLYTVIRVLLDTPSTPKTLSYLLLIFAFPVVGIIFYFSFGINYRHRQTQLKSWIWSQKIKDAFQHTIPNPTDKLLKQNPQSLEPYKELISFINNLGGERLGVNQFKLLINGEEKFPEVLDTLAQAKDFIHMEYYAWENDVRGNQIKDVLLQKAAEGVKIRVLFDDYASRGIKRNIAKELRAGGVEIHPVIKVRLKKFANRLNHRDHRKMIIVDGNTGFIGGINVSDRYDNSIDTGLYWRDTHVKITGDTVLSLQRNFLEQWNAAQDNALDVSPDLFPQASTSLPREMGEFAQVVAGGPTYSISTIMLSYLRIFTMAREKLYITNPYFIPNESILDALKQAAISGVDVRLLLPEKSDSALVGAASRFYFSELLATGVRIFLYQKGFIHAKTVAVDGALSIVGTANMDIRSFDLNFEIMSVIYGKNFSRQLEQVFLDDLKSSREVLREDWDALGVGKRLIYSIARLISSFL